MTPRSASGGLRASRGFTLIELLITVMILAAVVAALTTVLIAASRSKTSSANSIEASQAGRVAIDLIARDLRSAGYGADVDHIPGQPQPPIAYIDSMQVLINENLQPRADSVGNGVHSWPLAYNPSGSPNPFPLVGTSYTPPSSPKYLTGAETVRWTLDVNNDGLVNSADQASVNAVDAQHTRNPDDFELVRQVYGDSTGGVTNNNGGAIERVALVRRPGSGVPPLFTVYLRGSATPWSWSNGPVPYSQLKDIERVTVEITAPSGNPDWRGHYAESHYTTQVNSLRNTPDFGAAEYGIEGYVYEDLDHDSQRDAGEPGIFGATVRAGLYSVSSNASGYYFLSVPAGNYSVKDLPAIGYQRSSTPESLAVTVPPPVNSLNFGDSRIAGGHVRAFVFFDADNDGAYDTGEHGQVNCKLTLNPGARVSYTDTSGMATLFANAGSYTLQVTPPDSFTVTTPNPITSIIADGDTLSNTFGVYRAVQGTIRGKVFLDANRNGVLDAGEAGIGRVWVGVTTDGGVTVPGWAWSDSLTGAYSITVPINDPPHTVPYSVMVIPPAGRFPTSTTSINGIWLQNLQILTGMNFGMAAYTVIPLIANRVLCLASKDLIEKDWNGNHTENAVNDVDIVLGSDTGGSDQVSVWFNRYNATPLFESLPTYARSAPNAVMAMAVDTLDQNVPFKNRPDLVTGTKITASGNFFVWFNQGTNGNEGFIPMTFSPGQNYRTLDQGDVQAVLTLDCVGDAGPDMPDIVVGTKSPTAGQGTVEIWRNDNAVTPTFIRAEVLTTLGAGGSSIGEVTSIFAADIDRDGMKDLVLGTRTGSYSGQILYFKGTSKSGTPHYTYMSSILTPSDAITALVQTDVNGDSLLDLVAGSQSGVGTGHIMYYRCTDPTTFSFAHVKTMDAPGIVTSVVAADLGGSSRNDILFGFRQNATSYVGGVRILYTDSGSLPSVGVDPSAGGITNFVPALTEANFNYGTSSPAPTPYLTDFAVGVKVSLSTGALVVFIR